MIFDVETDKIYIYPLGGISKFNMPLNINPKKELMILVMGPIFQCLGAYIIYYLLGDDIVLKYHYGILFFNLLPIYPLDGGKLLNIILNYITPYKLSYKIIIIISYLMTVFILFINDRLSINMILTYIFLIIIIRREHLKIEYRYNKFLLERYLYKYKYKNSKIIRNENNFYRTKNNIIIKDRHYIPEKEYLSNKYNNKKKKLY